ncbi:DUF3352 domain-containing protein [Patescibacteria group bacterium]
MKISNLLKALSLAAVLTVLLTGCTSKIELHENDQSPEGVALENYLPIDTVLAMTLNLTDEGQKKDMAAIAEKFPQETAGKVIEGIIEELQMEFDALETNIQEDFAPAFGDSPRMMLAMSGTFDTPEEPQEDPDIYLASTLADRKKLEGIFDKWMENDPNYTKDELFNELIIDNESDDFYLAFYKDTFILTNKKQIRHEALKRMHNNEESLLSNDMYKKAYEKMQSPNLGTFYLNYENYFDFIATLEDTNVYPMKLKEDFDLAIMMGVFAENEGIKMLVTPTYSGDFNIPFHEPYLANGIPGDNLIMYMETYGMKQAVEMAFEDIYEFDEDTSKELRKAELLIKKTIGLDLREDVLSFMDKGVAFVWQRNETMVPALSLYVDATSNPQGAQEFIDLIDAAMLQAYDGMMMDAPKGVDAEKVIVKDKAVIGKSEINRMSFNFSEMSEEELLAAGLPSGIFSEPIEFYYGLTINNYLILSTYSGLEDSYGDVMTVGDTNAVEDGRELLKDYPYNLSYVSFEEGFKYVDQIFEDMEKVQGPMDDEAKEAYEAVREFFAPVKYMVGADQKEESVAYVRIEEVR